MLRSFLIYLSKATWAQHLVTGWKFAWRAASRFVAGNTIQDAIRVVQELNAKGINVTLDHLGESITTCEEAIRATDDILELLDQMCQSNVRANVSIKLTQIGLSLSESLCAHNLERILSCAKRYSNFIRIDMEDTPYTDRTISLFRQMNGRGFELVGLVIQSYLYRAEKDTRELFAEGARLRIVKGAYKEPAAMVFRKKADVDANFDLLTQIGIDTAMAAGAPTLSADGRIPPILALGTHDARRIAFAKKYATKVGLPKQALEIQMLYGIRRDLQERYVQESYPMRVYIPYGIHWYPYTVRRLAERPANLWFFLSNFFRK